MKFLEGAGLLTMALVLMALVGVGLVYAVFSQSFPSLERFGLYYAERPEPTRFYARDGETLLFTLAYEDFESRDLRVCEEDGDGCFPQRFLDAARLTREAGSQVSAAEAMVREVYADEISASRFPDLMVQQLVRQVRQQYGDDQILEWYYNRAWFGQMAFGLDAAARLYLDKSGDALSDAECVLLSAIISSPMLNPIDSNGAVRDSYLRQITLLYQAGLFTDEEAGALAGSNFTIFEPPQYIGKREPDLITRKALEATMNRYGREQVERGGLRIITSEDAGLQTYINCVTSSLDFDERAAACPLSVFYDEADLRDASEALGTAPVSIALVDVNTGDLLAAVEAQRNEEGARTYVSSQQAYPIGSTVNVFAALTAFSGGSSPSTLLWDLESSYEERDGGTYHGPVWLRDALTEDYQRVLSSHLLSFGTGAVQRNAALFGLNGSQMIPESELFSDGGSDTAEAVAFSLVPFATYGVQTGTTADGTMHPVTVLRIERDGFPDEDPQPVTRKTLIASNLAYLVHNVFSQESGSLSLSDRPTAVKVGTAFGTESRWVSGYSTLISCALRVDNPRTVSAFVVENDAVQGTAEILWRSVMEYAHRDLPAEGWETPDGVSRLRVCVPSGKLPTSACQNTITEIFLSGYEPYEYDEYYVEVPINRENRLLATRFTPVENVETVVFLNLPDDAAAWAEENGIESMPTAYDPIRDEVHSVGVTIQSPEEFQSFGQGDTIDVIARLAFSQQVESMQVSIGSGMYPTEWREVCSGGAMENGRWLLCSLDAATLDPGLYTLRSAFTLPNSRYHSAETYFVVE